MKKLILLALLFIPNALTAEVVKYKTHKCLFYYHDDPPVVSDDVFLVTLDIDNMKLHIYSRVEADYDLVGSINSWNDKDENMHVRFKAVNAEGKDCFAEFVTFGDRRHFNIGIYFSDYFYIYKLNRSY